MVNAKVVISACGSIHTPALLLRSGLKHKLIGKHLTLHPVIGAGGIFDKNAVSNKVFRHFCNSLSNA